MSTITYKCDTCKRKIEVLENTKGLTVFSKCIITDGCRGKLQKVSRNESNVRETFPSPESGLTDYFPRRAFYEHSQPVPARNWQILHQLSVSPEITVWEENSGQYTELDQDEYTVENISTDEVLISFPATKTGIAHCLAKTSVPIKPKLLSPEIPPERVTEDGSIVFAVPEIITDSLDPVNCPAPFFTRDRQLRVLVEVIKPNEEPVRCPEEITDDLIQTSWAGWDRSLVRNRRHYTLRTKEIINFRAFSDIITANEDIPEGTVIRFLGVDFGDGLCAAQAAENDPGTPDIPLEDQFRKIESRDLFVFLSREPFQAIDKVRDKLVDTGEMLGTDLDFFVYSNGDLYINRANIENTYPDIKQAPIPPVPSPTPTPAPSQLPCTLFGTDFDLNYDDTDSNVLFANLEIDYGGFAYLQFDSDGTYVYSNQFDNNSPPDTILENWSTDSPLTNGSNFEILWTFDGAPPPSPDALAGFSAPMSENVWVDLGSNRSFTLETDGFVCDVNISFIVRIRNPNIDGCEVVTYVTMNHYDEDCA